MGRKVWDLLWTERRVRCRHRRARSGITEIRAGRSNGANGESSRTDPLFGLHRHEKAESKLLARENRRVVFRALTNARIIAMATREFAIGPRFTMSILHSSNDVSARNHEKSVQL